MNRSLIVLVSFVLVLSTANGLEIDGNVDVLWNTSGFGYYGAPAIGDFNGDGTLDVVLINNNWDANTYTVTAFSGADGSVLWTYSLSGPSEIVGSSHDFNGDGINDILLSVDAEFRQITGGVYRSWYYVALDGTNGNRLWNTSLIEETYNGDIGWWMSERSVDITGDGIEDVLVSFEVDIWDAGYWNRIGAQSDIIAINGSSGELLWKRTYFVNGNDSWLTVKLIPGGDIDGVGGAEVLLLMYADWYNQTSGMYDHYHFTELVDYRNVTLMFFDDMDVALPGDLDGDGIDDLLLDDWYNDSVLAIKGDGSIIWGRDGRFMGLAGDVNGDGVTDVVIRNASAWDILHMVDGMDGTDIWTTNYTGWKDHVADLDGNGIFDIVLRSDYCEFDSVTGGTTCNVYLNAVNGETGRFLWNLTLYVNQSASFWIDPHNADINGDGADDLIGEINLYNTSGYFTGREIVAIDGRNGSIMWKYWMNESDGWMYYWDYPVGDFNGDGKDDLLISMKRYIPVGFSGIASVNTYGQPVASLPNDVPEYYRKLISWKDYRDAYYSKILSINSHDGLSSIKSFDSTVQSNYLYLSVLVSGDNPNDILWLASSDSWMSWISKWDYENDFRYYGWLLPPKKINWSMDFNGDGLSDVAYSSHGDFGVLVYNNTQVTNLHPIAAFTYSPEYPIENESIVFDASLSIDFDGQIVSYQWDFGDGTTANGMIANHSFGTGGNYYVVLTVTDDGGLTSSHGEWIYVAGNQSSSAPLISYFNITPGTKLTYVWNNTLYNPSPVIENITLTELQVESWNTVRYFFDFDNSGGAFGHYDIVMADGYFQRSGWHTTSQGGFGSLPLPMYGGFKYYISPSNIIPTNALAGQSWTGGDNLYGYSVNYSSFVEKFENVTTPAGTFYCAKIITYINSSNDFINGTRTMWIGESGLVKLIYNHSDGSVTRVELANVSTVQLPLDVISVYTTPGNGYVDVNITWVGEGIIMLGPINFTALDYVNITAATPTTMTFRLNLPLDAPSDYYFVHVVDRDQYFHFGDRLYIENLPMPVLTIPSATIVVNSTAEVPVIMSTPANVTGVNFTLHYDPSIVQIESYVPAVPSTLFVNIDNTNGTARFAIVFNNTTSGPIVPVINLTLKALATGVSELSGSGIEVSLEDFTTMPASVMNGTVTVTALNGDLDGDGRITIGDVTSLAWMLFGRVQQDSKADFNGNGRVDIGDLAKLAYYVLGKISEL